MGLATKKTHFLEVMAMAAVREGSKGVLLVVDVQVGVMQNTWDAARVIKNIGFTVERARNQGVPIIWVQHSDEAILVKEGFDLDPFAPALFVFCNRERNKLKILHWEHNGFWLFNLS